MGRFSTPLLFSVWLLLSANQANIIVHLSSLFSFLQGISGMLEWTLRGEGRYYCKQRCWGNRAGRKTEVWEPALGKACSSSVDVIALEKFTQFLSRAQFPHLQNRNQCPSMVSKEHWEVCLLMMLRMLGTYKYFLRRAGIFPLAIRLEEVCNISSVHL